MTRRSRELRAADTVGLLSRTRAGDRAAYDELFRRYRRFAYSVAHRTRAVEADEAVAEAFRRTMSAIDSGHGPSQAFGPYLATAIRSVVIEQRKHSQRERVAGSAEEVVGDRPVMLDPADVDPALAEAFADLPERWRNVIWYSDVEGFPPREVAKMLGASSANSVSTLRSRARLGLRAAYLKRLADEGHTTEVREYLAAMIAGSKTEAELDEAVRWHLEECDECAEVAGKLAGLSGTRLPAMLAPAVIVGLGFELEPGLLPGRALVGVGEAVATATRWGRVSAYAGVASAAIAVSFALVVATSPFDQEPEAVFVASPAPETASTDPFATATLPRPTSAIDAPVATVPPTVTQTVEPVRTDAPPLTQATTTSSPTTAPATVPATPVVITTAPATSAAPTTAPATAPVTTTPPTTTETAPGTTTTTVAAPTTTTTVAATTTTSTTTTTTIPWTGMLGGTWSSIGNTVSFDLRVIGLNGRPGAVLFDVPVEVVDAQGATCSNERCDFSGVTAPDEVVIDGTAAQPVSFTLLDDLGNTVDTATAG